MSRKCASCGNPHPGTFGQGKFCGISCLKRWSANKRWHPNHNCTTNRDFDGHGHHSSNPPGPQPFSVVVQCTPGADILEALVGMWVSVSAPDNVMHEGALVSYDQERDQHKLVTKSGELWVSLRNVPIRFEAVERREPSAMLESISNHSHVLVQPSLHRLVRSTTPVPVQAVSQQQPIARTSAISTRPVTRSMAATTTAPLPSSLTPLVRRNMPTAIHVVDLDGDEHSS